MADWLILKVFTKGLYSDPHFVEKVLAMRDICLPELSHLAGQRPYYFLHYGDTPEGPHFKFFVKTKNASPFLTWKRKNKGRTEIERIEKHSAKHSFDMEEGAKAREVFDRVKGIGKQNVIALKNALKADSTYQRLFDDDVRKGRHFLRNMLQMTYPEEKSFVDFYNKSTSK